MDKTEISKRLGLTGLGLCMLCCSLPLIGIFTGMAAITALSFYLEKIGIVLIGAALIFFLYTRIRREQAAPSCSVDCKSRKSVQKNA